MEQPDGLRRGREQRDRRGHHGRRRDLGLYGGGGQQGGPGGAGTKFNRNKNIA